MTNDKKELATTQRKQGYHVAPRIILDKVAHYPEDHQKTILKLAAWMERENLKQAEACKHIYHREKPLNISTLKGVLNGTLDNPEHVCRSIEKSLSIIAQTKVSQDFPNAFVPTRISRKIFAKIRLAHSQREPLFIIGDTRAGKTRTLREFQARHKGPGRVYLHTVCPMISGREQMRMLAREITGHGSREMPAIYEDIQSVIGKDDILIIDELHTLFTTTTAMQSTRVLEALRYLHDMVGFTLVLSGTKVLTEQLATEANAAIAEQMELRSSQGVFELTEAVKYGYNEDTRKEINAIAQSYGLPELDGDSELMEKACAMAIKNGALGPIFAKLNQAKSFWAESETLDWNHLNEAITRS
jgi:DNA transposition AAA+ family ATPase